MTNVNATNSAVKTGNYLFWVPPAAHRTWRPLFGALGGDVTSSFSAACYAWCLLATPPTVVIIVPGRSSCTAALLYYLKTGGGEIHPRLRGARSEVRSQRSPLWTGWSRFRFDARSFGKRKDRRRESLLHIEDAAGEETLPLSSAFSQSAAAASIPRVSPTSFSVLMSKPTWSGTGWGQQLVLLGQPRACHPIREGTRTRVLTGLTGRPSVVLSPSVGVFFF